MRILLIALIALLPACATRTAPMRSDSAPAVAPAPVTLASSREGRPIHACTFGSGATRVYLIASIHGDEPEGRSALEQIRAHLSSPVVHRATVRLVSDMNPDGSARKSRTNAAGVDLNRNWPASNFKSARAHGKNALSEPETVAVEADIRAFDPHVIVVLHSARGGPFVNYDGPASAAALAERFAVGARAGGDGRWRTVPDMGYPTPGSMGSYFGRDMQLPILTVELRQGDPESKIPAALLAGLTAVAEDQSVTLSPLSRSSIKRVARR